MLQVPQAREQTRDDNFAIQIGSDWPQMGQIWDFFRSDSVRFCSVSIMGSGTGVK